MEKISENLPNDEQLIQEAAEAWLRLKEAGVDVQNIGRDDQLSPKQLNLRENWRRLRGLTMQRGIKREVVDGKAAELEQNDSSNASRLAA